MHQHEFTVNEPGITNALAGIRAWSEDTSVPEAQRSRLLIVVEELVRNTWQHGTPPGSTCSASITIDSTANSLSLTYADNGLPFNPLLHHAPDQAGDELDGHRVGGVGVRIVRTYAVNPDYQHVDGWNRLSLQLSAD